MPPSAEPSISAQPPSPQNDLRPNVLPRAKPPQAPPQSATATLVKAARDRDTKAREQQERQRFLRGLVTVAILVLLASLLRAGWGRAFIPGWWRQW